MSASREVIVSKSLLRIVAVVAVAALIFGTVAAALGSLAGADDGRQQQPTTAPTSAPSELDDVDRAAAEEVVASFAAKLGASTAQTKAALRTVATQLALDHAPRSEDDFVALRTAATKALGTELGLPASTVDDAVTEQIIETYTEYQLLIEQYLEHAVSEGHLTQDQADALLDAAADGSIGSTHGR